MKSRFFIIPVLIIIVSIFAVIVFDYFVYVEPSLIDHPLVKNCGPSEYHPTILIANSTHEFNFYTCTWHSKITPTSEPDVMDSLKISNAERDAKLAAGYKLYPGVGRTSPDEQKNAPTPIYIKNPNNPDEQILDIDAMIWVQKILDKCDYVQKLESGEIPWRNPDGSFNVIRGDLPFFNNGTHYIDSNYCNWVNSLESITYNCFEANPMEQNWHSGPGYFDNGTHHLDAQKCEWTIYSEEYSGLPL